MRRHYLLLALATAAAAVGGSLWLGASRPAIPRAVAAGAYSGPGSETRGPVRLLAVGDLMLGTTVKELIRTEGVDYPFREAKGMLGKADITFGNLETALSERGTPTPAKSPESIRAGRQFIFRAPPGCAQGLANAGFDVVSIANNHTMDLGAVGLRDTIQALRQAGVEPVGGGANASEALAPAVLTRQGLRVAFLAVSDIVPGYSAAGRRSSGIAVTQRNRPNPALARAIAKAKRQADFVVVSIHWGVERTSRPTAWQQSLGRQMIRWGADVVLGSHPHVLQPVERYRTGIIHYSLGNFITYVRSRQRTEAIEVRLQSGHAPTYRLIGFDIRGGQASPRP
jgi:poly-gamma-glutamate capsule biosynthesis protein CapA/YwtB (metallophosphatase superfamily)